MSMINIPPEAVEAAARALCIAREGDSKWWTLYMRAATDVLEAGLAAWPGSFPWTFTGRLEGTGFVLPFNTENQ